MTTLPHDITDLLLAPTALAIDARLAELGSLSDEELALRIGVESDSADYSVAMRESGIVRTVGHLIDLHGWKLDWDPRGIRLTNDAHTFVLGAPANVLAYHDRG